MAWFRKKSSGAPGGAKAIVFYTYPKLLFVWPLILLGYVLWIVDGSLGGEPPQSHDEVLAWIWGLGLIFTILAMGVDLGRNTMAFWVVVIIALLMLALWLTDAKNIPVFREFKEFFAGLDASYSPGLGLMVSICLTIPYIAMYLWSRLNDKWRFTHNEFEHRSFGKVDWSAARAAKTVRTSYPDVLEAILCLAGDLIIYDARGSKIIRRIPHVPLLPLVRRRIDVILEVTAVTTAQIEDEQDSGEESGDDEPVR